jgi:uncharacterized membrane protein
MSWAGRPVVAGVLVGIGVAAFLDEAVFHQILHWHHFYDGSPAAGLVSDGLFHAFGWICTVVGLFLYADLRRRDAADGRLLWGGGLLGWGGFQVYDGLVQHKLLDLHQIRYRVDLLPYDLAWNAAGLLGVAAGLLLLRGGARRRSPASARP